MHFEGICGLQIELNYPFKDTLCPFYSQHQIL